MFIKTLKFGFDHFAPKKSQNIVKKKAKMGDEFKTLKKLIKLDKF